MPIDINPNAYDENLDGYDTDAIPPGPGLYPAGIGW